MPVCNTCSCHRPLGFKVKMAFQPIVNITTKEVFAYEALVRGENGEGAGEVLARVNEQNIYTFDQTCRKAAIATAAKINLPTRLSINFMPNAIYEPETCLAVTLKAAAETGFPKENIIFEVTEHERIGDNSLLLDVFQTYRKHGFKTAIDDFGEGYAGLNLLADFQPDILKIDMKLIRNCHEDRAKKAILAGIKTIADELNISLVAEGIETPEEYRYLQGIGIELMQGYLFAKPAIEQAPEPVWPD